MSLDSHRTGPMLMHNTMRITDGHLDDFEQAIERSVQFVEQHGPQLMVQVFIDRDEMLAHSFQLFPDSAAVRRHWTLSDEYIGEVMKYCSIDRIDVYGEPDDSEVARGVQDALSPTTPRRIHPRHTGFLRL